MVKWVRRLYERKWHYTPNNGRLSLCGRLLDGLDSELSWRDKTPIDDICPKCKKTFEKIINDFVESGWEA